MDTKSEKPEAHNHATQHPNYKNSNPLFTPAHTVEESLENAAGQGKGNTLAWARGEGSPVVPTFG